MGGGGGRGARRAGDAESRGRHSLQLETKGTRCCRVSDRSWVAGARTPVLSRGRQPRAAPGGQGEESEGGAGRLCLQVRAEVSRLEPELARGDREAAREPAGQRLPLRSPESALREAPGPGGLGLRRGLPASLEEG